MLHLQCAPVERVKPFSVQAEAHLCRVVIFAFAVAITQMTGLRSLRQIFMDLSSRPFNFSHNVVFRIYSTK